MEREDRLWYNLISSVYGVHNPEFAQNIQKDTYNHLYEQPDLDRKVQRMIELYKQVFEHGRQTAS